MSEIALASSAAAIGFLHTIIGVDHFVPFITLGRAQNWSLTKTLTVTGLCGVGHVLGSLIFAFAGIALGTAVESVEGFEGSRGAIASWILIAFGFSYAAWGIWNTMRGKQHTHGHIHDDGTFHEHEHNHKQGEHLHVHEAKRVTIVTMMSMFIIFVFGPCEFMIAPVMAAYNQGWSAVLLVSIAFSIATIGTMLGAVALGFLGVKTIRFEFFERHIHTFSGLAIAASGLILPFLES